MLVVVGVIDKGKIEHAICDPKIADGLAGIDYERVDPFSARPPFEVCPRSSDRFRAQVDGDDYILEPGILRGQGSDRSREAVIGSQFQNIAAAEIYEFVK